MRQGWLKEILEENRRELASWPEWKKARQADDPKESETVEVKEAIVFEQVARPSVTAR